MNTYRKVSKFELWYMIAVCILGAGHLINSIQGG